MSSVTCASPTSRPAASASPAAAPRPSPDRYVRNLSALYVSDPDLAVRIDALPFASGPALELARDGCVTAQRPDDVGRPVYLHSRYAPAEEARTLVERQIKQSAERRRGQDRVGDDRPLPADEQTERLHDTFIVLGLGLGYHVQALAEKHREPVVVVAERDLGLIKAALCLFDFEDALRTRRLTLIADDDKATVHDRLRGILTHVMLGSVMLTLPHTARVGAAFYASFSRLFRDFVTFSRVQLYTLIRNARTTIRNIAFNLPKYIASPGVEVLEGRARGYPAILVAAGPSLARNVDQLHALRGRAIIIAAQTVLKTLLARGIRPHFVTSLDYHEISAQFFHGVEGGDVRLVAEPKANWHVLDTFPGRTHVLRSAFVDDLLRGVAPPRGALPAGSTVAHLSFYLAEHLGCDPIILIGQDLSFTEGLYYPAGTPIERMWQAEFGRFGTIEMKQWERIVRGRSHLRKVADIHGRDVYTEEAMFVYAEQFQADFLQSPRRVIHATEGGMQLGGCEIMSLREAAEQFCTRPLPDDLLAADPTGARIAPDAAADALEARVEELRAVRDIATETTGLLERLAGLVEKPDAFNRLVPKVDELRSRMARYDRTYEMVTQVAQLGELQRINADRAIFDDVTETAETARRRIRRDRSFVAALLDGCEFLLTMLPEAIRRLREGAV